jgi:hypothetical protein
MQIDKNFSGMGKAAVARWVCFELDSRDWRTTASDSGLPLRGAGNGWKEQIG